MAEVWVRIEQNRIARQIAFEEPKTLVVNLLWFFYLKDLKSAAHLKQVTPRPDV